jgi:phage terminase Nu1 subunit (DNA packaging protein)
VSATVHRIGAAQTALITKAQLAAHLGRSPRWIEMRMRDGLPSKENLDRYGRRLFDLAAVEEWLRAGRPRATTVAERLAVVEDELARLRATVAELKRRAS